MRRCEVEPAARCPIGRRSNTRPRAAAWRRGRTEKGTGRSWSTVSLWHQQLSRDFSRADLHRAGRAGDAERRPRYRIYVSADDKWIPNILSLELSRELRWLDREAAIWFVM